MQGASVLVNEPSGSVCDPHSPSPRHNACQTPTAVGVHAGVHVMGEVGGGGTGGVGKGGHGTV